MRRRGSHSLWLFFAVASFACVDPARVERTSSPLGTGIAGPCDGSRFPANLANAEHCCQDGPYTWHKVTISGPSLGKVVQRFYPGPCQLPDGGVGCGIGSGFPDVQCASGPCGALNEWITTTAEAQVFVPHSQPTVCGWHRAGCVLMSDAAGASCAPTNDHPETYDGTQQLWGGVTNTCPYLQCLPDGTPVVTGFAINVTAVEDEATGRVASSPTGISFSGAGIRRWGYGGGTAVSFTATPVNPAGGCARAVFSGGCVGEGAPGVAATCSLTMDATRSVTVTYRRIADATPPAITGASVAPAVLWPPNHEMIPVHVSAAVSDVCDPAPTCRIVSVSSNEAVGAEPDWQVTGDLDVLLRAERSGKGAGRVYDLEVACADASGNSASTHLSVTVPHDRQ